MGLNSVFTIFRYDEPPNPEDHWSMGLLENYHTHDVELEGDSVAILPYASEDKGDDRAYSIRLEEIESVSDDVLPLE